MPRINLLPWREEQRKERKLTFMVAMGAAVRRCRCWSPVPPTCMFNSAIDSQEQRNERLRAEIKQLDKQIEEINNLETAKQNFIARMEIIEKLQRSRPEIVHVFDEIVRTLPGRRVSDRREADRQAFQVRRRGAVEHARVHLHAQHRRLRLAAAIRSSRSCRPPPRAAPGSSFTLFADQVCTATDDARRQGQGQAAGQQGRGQHGERSR